MLHNIILHHSDGNVAVFVEKRTGRWDYTFVHVDDGSVFRESNLSSDIMLATVFRSVDAGAALKIVKGESDSGTIKGL